MPTALCGLAPAGISGNRQRGGARGACENKYNQCGVGKDRGSVQPDGRGPMDLYFVCPLTGRGFMSGNWRIKGELRMEVDTSGKKRLEGEVEVDCPHCRGIHVYAPEELACPWSQAGGC